MSIAVWNSTTQLQVKKTSDLVCGLFLCRGDVPAEKCRACMADAAKKLASRCSWKKIAIIWYNECMLCYSNESFFSIVAVRPRVATINTQNTTSQGFYNELVNTMIIDLAK
ncbi:Cysteine-rich receptor-like protein kinase 25 [Morella rubra]|uniref:Cysteine-rich receptor-like protein kinase 25 n=1 Tax=Morella rubra TaxID=262757 RepID=A0A6A1V641_9ROSI|nr:Cysteine-rich receptor-like protein kinase 25 [Morella rubra]